MKCLHLEVYIKFSYPPYDFFLYIYINLFIIYLFIFGCVGSSLLRTGFLLVAASRGYSSLWCTGFSLQWLLLLQSTGSRRAGFSSCGSWALELRLSSFGARAWLLRSMWDLPGPGMNPCPLHWQADSQPLCHQGSPPPYYFKSWWSRFGGWSS